MTPGPAAVAMQAANDLNRLIIDDGPNVENPDPIVFGRMAARCRRPTRFVAAIRPRAPSAS